jgi:hypothetical protein
MPGINHNSNTLTSPVWAADYLSRDHLVPGPIELDPTAFLNEDGTTAVVDAAGAAANATSIPLKAGLANAIPNGTLLYFGASKKLAMLTAAAAAGATSLTVQALPTTLVENDTATYAGAGIKKKRVVAGTYVGRTFTERESNAPFGPVASGDEERFLIAFDVIDLAENVTATPVRPGTAIKENRLPGYSVMSATIKGYLRADYTTQKGTD